MSTSTVHKFMYKWMWDSRSRCMDTRRVLRPFLTNTTTILDAGCGEYGLAAFMPSAKITGVDILPDEDIDSSVNYVHGSIIDLPFEEGSVDVAAAVDVLEHLPNDLRPAAVQQLVRVAKKAIVLTFPSGDAARRVDEDFSRALRSREKANPEWLDEHLANIYPDVEKVIEEIEAASKASGRKVVTSVFYSEPVTFSKFVRWAAARSPYFFIIGGLLGGILIPLIPRATRKNAYRAIILANFDGVQTNK
jgi:ubiquinone/menaquinone biosynthesis C-methylase UbiE